jgi:prepilin-type N-terminal cleavage/methylation domain-containing protein
MTGDLPSRRRLGLLPGPRRGGFTLVELLVTLALSGLVSAVVLQLLVGDLRQVGRLGRWLRERQAGERALELVREELQRAESASLSGMIPAGCGEDRKLALQLRGRDRAGQLRTVTYTTGTAPSSIWRGAVLVRCGPAYGLDGEWSASASSTAGEGEESGGVSRGLIDALPGEAGFTVTPGAPGLLQLVLERQLADGQTIRQEQVALEPPPSEQP